MNMHIRVYYEDTDCGNVVYYANYLRFLERSRTELLREQGIDLAELHKRGILFVVDAIQQGTCWQSIRSVRKENGSGTLSPG